MNVVFLAPAYPPEMIEFTRGLAEVGAQVFGVGDAPVQALSPRVRPYLTDYLQVPRLLDEADVQARVVAWMRGRSVDRVEAQWEPLVILAARLREQLGVPGMSLDTVMGFRDKELMKRRIAAAGLRVPHSARVRTPSEAWAAAERIGFPLIVKPIAGAGSADTYRVDDAAELKRVLARVRHVAEVSVEEFVDGEEFTYDTLCLGGAPCLRECRAVSPAPSHCPHQRVDQPRDHHDSRSGTAGAARWDWARARRTPSPRHGHGLHAYGVVSNVEWGSGLW